MSDDVEEMVKREVAEARRILREDRVLVSNAAILARLDKHFPDEPQPANPDKPQPPKKKEEPETGQPEKKPGVWWGDKV